MAQVSVTFVNECSGLRGERKTLMIGHWRTHDDRTVSKQINCDNDKPKRRDSTASTLPTCITPTKIKFDKRGRPEQIEIYDNSDDWSVSTMGDSIFQDAHPGRESALVEKPTIIVCGTF